MVEFKNRDEIKAWLKIRPREEISLVAARAALRLLPTLGQKGLLKMPTDLKLQCLRAIAAPWLAGRWPDLASEVKVAANARALNATSVAATANHVAEAASTDASLNAAAAAGSAIAAGAVQAVNAAAAGAAADAATSAAKFARAAARASDPSRAAADIAADADDYFVLDATFLNHGGNVKDLSGKPLWFKDDMPHDLAQMWDVLKIRLLAEDEDWDVWTDWYEDRLRGTPANMELERARVLIPNEDWEKGPAHVNAIIKRLIEDHALAASPQGERLLLDEEQAVFKLAPRAVDPSSAHGNACMKVADRLEVLRPRLDENQLTAIRPVVEDLDRTVTRYAEYPRRVHDDFETAVVNIQALLESRELADDLAVTNLQRDLETGILDIRDEDPAIAELVEARAKIRMRRLSPEDRERIAETAEKVAGASDPVLGEQIIEDAKVLKDAPDEPTPPEGVPEGQEKSAGYRLAGRLLRMRPMAEKIVGYVDKFDKIMKIPKWIGIIGGLLYGLLGF